jgi:O-antigen biosynthesis protein WbqP
MRLVDSRTSYFIIKRTLDFTFSIFLSVLLTPLMILICIFIILESKGSPLFVQKRVGKNNKLFNCFKFRTMKVDTPNISTELMQESKINYVTKVGFWLRRFSLDELPQMFNVVLGDMSFVGPRPALPSQNQLITSRSSNEINKLLPGITGLAQVMGRDNLTDDEKLRFEIDYKDKMSIFSDLKIILLTILVVFNAKGNK